MGVFIFKQPNGLYGRFSTVVDCITHYNMTEDDYVKWRMECAKEEAINTLTNHAKPYELIDEYFIDNNMTKEEFKQIKKEMEEVK